LWVVRDTTKPEQLTQMLRGLAYLRMECSTVKAGDYGSDLFGGSSVLKEVKPYKRLPTWRRGSEGPAFNYDVALHLDFDGWAGHDAYTVDPVHNAASEFNESVAWDELTARVDWWYDGDPPQQRGLVRHVEMFVWSDDADEERKRRAVAAAEGLRSADGVTSVAVGHNVGKLMTDFDWILDVQVTDRKATEGLLSSSTYADVMATVAQATKYEWTARLSHAMRIL
jgi:hypothetical protein